jgi:hypothetical protein
LHQVGLGHAQTGELGLQLRIVDQCDLHRIVGIGQSRCTTCGSCSKARTRSLLAGACCGLRFQAGTWPRRWRLVSSPDETAIRRQLGAAGQQGTGGHGSGPPGT